MVFNKRRVEQDLERIRKANLTDEQRAHEEAQAQEEQRRLASIEKIGKKDILAMIIAAFSVILPYVLVFVSVWLAFGLLVTWWAR